MVLTALLLKLAGLFCSYSKSGSNVQIIFVFDKMKSEIYLCMDTGFSMSWNSGKMRERIKEWVGCVVLQRELERLSQADSRKKPKQAGTGRLAPGSSLSSYRRKTRQDV